MEGGYRRQWPLFWFSFALLIFVLLGVLYVALFGAVLAFKDYQALHGMAGSPWAGYTNFSSLMVLYALKDFLIKRLGSLLEHTT